MSRPTESTTCPTAGSRIWVWGARARAARHYPTTAPLTAPYHDVPLDEGTGLVTPPGSWCAERCSCCLAAVGESQFGANLSDLKGAQPDMKLAMVAHKKLLLMGLSALTITSISAATMFSMALFTDQETDQSTFTTGTIVLDATKIAALDLTSSVMMPGDSVRSSVTVENDGIAQLRYAVSQTSTNPDTKDLRSSLLLVVKTEDAGGGTDFGTDGDYCDDATRTTFPPSP